MIIGLTGNYGSGKTTVANMFQKLGATIIDVDKIGHDVLQNEAYKQVAEEFGNDILKEDSTIDRNKLGDIVFQDKEKLNKLNKIMHPIMLHTLEVMTTNSKETVVLEAAVLVEMGLFGLVEKVIVIKCNKQKERIENPKTDLILKSQLPERELLEYADYVIDNNGTEQKTELQVKEVWNDLKL